MKKIDELKKWLNELNSHYASLQKMKALLPQDRNYWDAYNSVMTKITEIEASEISSSAVLAVSVCRCYRDNKWWNKTWDGSKCEECGKTIKAN